MTPTALCSASTLSNLSFLSLMIFKVSCIDRGLNEPHDYYHQNISRTEIPIPESAIQTYVQNSAAFGLSLFPSRDRNE